MGNQQPSALIQIHYHDRLGGVRQVMIDYSNVFAARFGGDAPNRWWCKHSGAECSDAVQVEDLPGADYHSFVSARAYRESAERLTRILLQRLEALPVSSGSVAVVGHNLALGKNPALSEAFAEAARRTGGRYRFYSVLHDFAEQGRFDLLSKFELLRRSGVTVGAALYAEGAPVHFVAPDPWVREVTGLSEAYLSILPNQVKKRGTIRQLPDREQTGRLLKQCADLDGLFFDPQLPLYCYPSRMIYRKNILEALLLTAVLGGGSLVTGPSGTTAADQRRMRAAVDIARRYRLSLAIDPGRCIGVSSEFGRVVEKVNPFHLILPWVNGAVTTSLAEGFGYSLHEPGLYGISLAGRFPEGISPSSGNAAHSLYRRLPVPCSWVHLDSCYRRYCLNLGKLSSGNLPTKESFMKAFIKHDTVDFGHLGTKAQTNIIHCIIHSDQRREELLQLHRKIRCGPLFERVGRTDSVSPASPEHKDFVKSFVKLLTRPALPPDPPYWYRKIALRYQYRPGVPILTPAAGTD